MKHFSFASILLAAALLSSTAHADVKLPAVISDHMVLQADTPVTVWGWADAGEMVKVTFAGQLKSTNANADGKWSVRLDELKASNKAQTLTVKGDNAITVNDVLVGEVWLASGQSNMEMQIKGKMHGSVDHADEEIAAAKHPDIRLFVHDKPFVIYEVPEPPDSPLADRPGKWTVCSPETVADFSAMGYFFARTLNKELGTPVGILSASVGGTPIEAWTSHEAQEPQAVLKPLLDDWQKRLSTFDAARDQKSYLDAKDAWQKQKTEAIKKKEAAPKAPSPFKNIGVMKPGRLFNGVIAPLVPYTIRGCIWYQGERNAAGAFTGLYGKQLETLIADWRARWGADFYFAWVQLPRTATPQRLPSEPTGWGVAVRDEMRRTLSVPHTGMAITMDLGGEKAGHPTNKRDYAARLSPVVLHDVYGKNIAEWQGPLYRAAQRVDDKMLLSFDHAAGLKSSAGDLEGFAIAGANKKFEWAKAKVEGGKVIVWSDSVKQPEAVRYAYAANPKGNLVNGAGIPASPFRTDDWETVPAVTAGKSTSKEKLSASTLEPLPLMDMVKVGAFEFSTKTPPRGLKVDHEAGLLMVNPVNAQVVHRTKTRILETRATITPNGDYLLMFPEGDHYAKSKGEKINSMMACRSTDHGKTWSAPAVAYDIPYGQHGFIPLIPKDTKRLYCFGTQPIPGKWTWEDGKRENAPIGYRWSDDDGHTWSDVQLIAPVNDPGFMGMSVMRMTETDAGTWLVGSHLADWSVKPFTTQQYLLRSEDKGKSWTVIPGARPNGWTADGFNRMDEGRPLNLGGGHVLFMSRTPQGHLFCAWSQDDGKTWTKPAPSTLVHPDAPPMLFPLSDGKTLVAFHHNKVPVTGNGDLDDKAENMKVRSEIWASLSTDEGHTWSVPRFVVANAVAPNLKVSGFNSQCSYLDAFTEDGVMHIFMPHRWQQVLHLTIKEDYLGRLPTKGKLATLVVPTTSPKTSATEPTTKKPEAKKSTEPVYAAKLAQAIKPTRKMVYRKTNDQGLTLDIFQPAGWKRTDKRACFVSIHGGGWTSGAPGSMYAFTDHCAKLGMVAISVQYRLYKPNTDVTVTECVKDARAAVRFVRAHAEALGIDPQKIVVNGSSAGGHLAVATALFDGMDHADADLKVSCRPDALVLFSPVIDTSEEGYGHAKVGQQWKALSPAHQVRAGMPPTILFHGTADTTTPYKGAQLFDSEMRKAGNRMELMTQPEAEHTYMFKDATLFAETVKKLDAFLSSLGFVPKDPPKNSTP
jgi:sialate O-acetylesterase